MGDFKAYFIQPSLESTNNLVFHSSVLETVSEVAMSAVEDSRVEVIVVAMVMAVVVKEDVVEGAMVKTHMNFPAGVENSLWKLVYTLQTNGDSYTRNKIMVLNKRKFVSNGEDFTFYQQVTNYKMKEN